MVKNDHHYIGSLQLFVSHLVSTRLINCLVFLQISRFAKPETNVKIPVALEDILTVSHLNANKSISHSSSLGQSPGAESQECALCHVEKN